MSVICLFDTFKENYSSGIDVDNGENGEWTSAAPPDGTDDTAWAAADEEVIAVSSSFCPS